MPGTKTLIEIAYLMISHDSTIMILNQAATLNVNDTLIQRSDKQIFFPPSGVHRILRMFCFVCFGINRP